MQGGARRLLRKCRRCRHQGRHNAPQAGHAVPAHCLGQHAPRVSRPMPGPGSLLPTWMTGFPHCKCCEPARSQLGLSAQTVTSHSLLIQPLLLTQASQHAVHQAHLQGPHAHRLNTQYRALHTLRTWSTVRKEPGCARLIASGGASATASTAARCRTRLGAGARLWPAAAPAACSSLASVADRPGWRQTSRHAQAALAQAQREAR